MFDPVQIYHILKLKTYSINFIPPTSFLPIFQKLGASTTIKMYISNRRWARGLNHFPSFHASNELAYGLSQTIIARVSMVIRTELLALE